MKFYCELRACLVQEDAINFRFFPPGLFHKLLAGGRRRSVPGMFTAFVRVIIIYIQTDFCVKPCLTKRETRSETTAVLIVRNAIDIWLGSTVWQRQSQPKCMLGETNKETRKYKYGAVRSRDHFKTTQHVQRLRGISTREC